MTSSSPRSTDQDNLACCWAKGECYQLDITPASQPDDLNLGEEADSLLMDPTFFGHVLQWCVADHQEADSNGQPVSLQVPRLCGGDAILQLALCWLETYWLDHQCSPSCVRQLDAMLTWCGGKFRIFGDWEPLTEVTSPLGVQIAHARQLFLPFLAACM